MGATSNPLKNREIRDEPDPWTAQRATADRSEERSIPLTTALLDVALHGVSFATPGHRGGRSWRLALQR